MRNEAKESLRVLHIVPWFYPAVVYGGPIFSVLNLCRELTQLGDSVCVLTTDANGQSRIPASVTSIGVEGLSVSYTRSWHVGRGIAPGIVPRIWQEISRADVVHLTMVYDFTTLPTLLITRLRSKPLVWSPRGTLQRWAKSRRPRAKAVFDQGCRLLVPPHTVLHVTSEEEQFESTKRVGLRDCELIPNGVPIPTAYEAPEVNHGLRMLYLGRLDPKKGLENLFEAAAQLCQAGLKDWSLNIAGDGERGYVRSLRARVTELGLNERVRFLGRIDGEAKTATINQCNLFVAPSFTENFGISIAEALAHGRAVIAGRGTPWSGLELRQCGKWTANDPLSLISAIKEMSQSDLITLGRNGRKWMQSDFSWADKARQMHQLYRRLVQPPV